ncbi:MAG: lasso peptide biosynthesis B2 protein [Acidobacteriota bacterium]
MRSRPALLELASKALFLVVALPVVVRAALRLSWLNHRYDLEQLVDRLRAVRPWPPSYLANPRYLGGTAWRLLSLLPPRGFGPCLKHSLLLLDLWSRCGLEPRIHIGTMKAEERPKFHAWITVADPNLPPQPNPSEYAEVWSH